MGRGTRSAAFVVATLALLMLAVPTASAAECGVVEVSYALEVVSNTDMDVAHDALHADLAESGDLGADAHRDGDIATAEEHGYRLDDATCSFQLVPPSTTSTTSSTTSTTLISGADIAGGTVNTTVLGWRVIPAPTTSEAPAAAAGPPTSAAAAPAAPEPQASSPPPTTSIEDLQIAAADATGSFPILMLTPVAGLLGGGVFLFLRRRRQSAVAAGADNVVE